MSEGSWGWFTYSVLVRFLSRGEKSKIMFPKVVFHFFSTEASLAEMGWKEEDQWRTSSSNLQHSQDQTG
ncbi:hypothetical protein RJT34_02869 [Clitoria ternatea]|uniref:Uncharacterized protein n=1 Tax=Clitoria ternatea TaxID=43366 RepID=A0AAN9PZA1_CLITE